MFESDSLKEYKVALYCRLSTDDGNLGESMSIQNQKLFLEKYAKDNGATYFSFYVDDGYTGTNFKRPDFQRMIADIENGKINCVITKDLSRFGRNYLEVGAYLEAFFPQHHVRYIAVNDATDSINPEGYDITPFKNILNEFYSRDISKKVKTGRAIRARQGKYMSTYAPFGYMKDPEDHNHLLIDETQAETIRLIFSLALTGIGTKRISKILEERHIPRPAFYKQQEYGKYMKSEDDFYVWKTTSILLILRNPLYKGGQYIACNDRKSFKQKSKGYISIANREIIEDTHEPIISKAEWDAVQDIIDKHTHFRPNSAGIDNCFRGILKCADCGKTLNIHAPPKNRPNADSFYQCKTYREYGKQKCTSHRIKAEDIERLTLEILKDMAKEVIGDPDKFVKSQVEKQLCKLGQPNKNITRKIKQLEKELQSLEDKFIGLYDNFAEGLIPKERYLALTEHYEKQISAKKEELSKFSESIKQQEDAQVTVKSFADMFTAYGDDLITIEKLTPEIVNRFFKEIIIGKTVFDEKNVKQQSVEFVFKYLGSV